MTEQDYTIRMFLLSDKGQWIFEKIRRFQYADTWLNVLYDYCPGQGIVLFQIWENDVTPNDNDVKGLVDAIAGNIDYVRERVREKAQAAGASV